MLLYFSAGFILLLARLTVASADYFDHVIKVARFLSVICLRLALVPCSAVRCTIQLALVLPLPYQQLETDLPVHARLWGIQFPNRCMVRAS